MTTNVGFAGFGMNRRNPPDKEINTPRYMYRNNLTMVMKNDITEELRYLMFSIQELDESKQHHLRMQFRRRG